MTDDLTKLISIWKIYMEQIVKEQISRQSFARFLAGAAGGASRAAGFSWTEFEEQARRGWSAAENKEGN